MLDFSRRRFLTISSLAVSSLFVPKAFAGVEGEIVAAEADRYARLAANIKKATDVLQTFPIPASVNAYRDENQATFDRLMGEALTQMMDDFPDLPPLDRFTEHWKVIRHWRDEATDGHLDGFDTDRLRTISADLVPVTTVKSLLAVHRLPITARCDGLTKFAEAYYSHFQKVD